VTARLTEKKFERKDQMTTAITKENSIAILSNSVHMGQKMGAFLLKEASLLNKAIDYFKSDVKEKPDFGGVPVEQREIVAINLLVQGVQKAQSHGGEFAYSINDASLLWDIIEFLTKDTGKSVSKPNDASKSDENEEVDDLDEIKVRPISGKGKSAV
jgi:hypothetical protein